MIGLPLTKNIGFPKKALKQDRKPLLLLKRDRNPLNEPVKKDGTPFKKKILKDIALSRGNSACAPR